MTDTLNAIAYISRHAAHPAKLTKGEIDQILQTARRKNRQSGLTGALLFTETYFAQIIEGPEEALEETFERIQMDPRHDNVRVLYMRPIQSRAFSEWTMANAGKHEDAAVEGLIGTVDAPSGISATDSGKATIDTLTTLLRRSNLS